MRRTHDDFALAVLPSIRSSGIEAIVQQFLNHLRVLWCEYSPVVYYYIMPCTTKHPRCYKCMRCKPSFRSTARWCCLHKKSKMETTRQTYQDTTSQTQSLRYLQLLRTLTSFRHCELLYIFNLHSVLDGEIRVWWAPPWEILGFLRLTSSPARGAFDFLGRNLLLLGQPRLVLEVQPIWIKKSQQKKCV